MNEADFRSRDIKILTAGDDDGDDDMDEEEKALKEYRLRMAALLPESGTGKDFKEVYENQDALDANFMDFLDKEYDDDKLGGLDDEDIQVEDKVENKKMLDDACNEFIEDKKRWFMDLAKEFGDEKAQKLFPDIKSSEIIHEEDLKNGEDPEEVK